MSDTEQNEATKAPEMDEKLERILVAALNEAKRAFLEEGALVPFTALAEGDMLEINYHAVGDVQDCFADAERCVAAASGKEAYAFCYDGYVDTDEGERDILIAEGGMPGDEDGHAIGFIYFMPQEEGGEIEMEEEPVYVGFAPNFMAGL